MGKQSRPRRLFDNEASATTRNIRVSPRKLNLVAATIRNKPVKLALQELFFSKRRIAQDVRKTLNSAILNADTNHQLDIDRLVVKRVEVGKALVMKRFQARGRGRSAGIEKFFSNLSIVVAEQLNDQEASNSKGKKAE